MLRRSLGTADGAVWVGIEVRGPNARSTATTGRETNVGWKLGDALNKSSATSQKHALTCCFGGVPPGARTRHLGIKSPLLYLMS